MVDSTSRRQFVGLVGALLTAGCTGLANGNRAASSDPLEKDNFELADIQPQPLQSYDGVTAVVYNNGGDAGTVTVQFTAYDSGGNQLHQGTDSVTVPSFNQAPVSKYWEKDPDASPFQGWDAKITLVKSHGGG